VGPHRGGAAGRPARASRPRGQSDRGEKDTVGYDAGKKVKGRKLHALADVDGLPLRLVVHSAGMQDRGGAGLVLAKLRKRFPWLELVWADSGYNTHQVKEAVGKSPGLRCGGSQRRTQASLFGLAKLVYSFSSTTEGGSK
jgi:hypothetical protein